MVTPSKAGENVEKPASSGMAGENKKTVQNSLAATPGLNDCTSGHLFIQRNGNPGSHRKLYTNV